MSDAAEAPGAGRSVFSRGYRIALGIVAWFSLLSCLGGAVAIVFGDGAGMPLEWLDGSPFASYLWPGIILGVVVGGSQAVALLAQWRGFALARGAHIAAGLVMTIWIFVELMILPVTSILHTIYFTAGAVQIVLGTLSLAAWPHPLLAREPRG